MSNRLTTDQAYALRRHYATLAYLYSDRCVDALLDGRHGTAARWERAYRNAARGCRSLGEHMRAGPTSGFAVVATSDVRPETRRRPLPALAGNV
jgi:hypothetical protein